MRSTTPRSLRFPKSRFGAEVANLSPWWRSVTGDLTSAFNLARPNRSVPRLPKPSLLAPRVLLSNCLTTALHSLVTDLAGGFGGLGALLLPPHPRPSAPQT